MEYLNNSRGAALGPARGFAGEEPNNGVFGQTGTFGASAEEGGPAM
jgi:hypothetical protein